MPNLDYFQAHYYSGEQGRFLSVDPENAGADASNPQSWHAYSYGLNSPLTYTDPDGRDPVWATCPGCTVTVNGGAQGLSPLDQMFYLGLRHFTAATFQLMQQAQQTVQPVLDWASRPRNPTCLAASTAAGASLCSRHALLHEQRRTGRWRNRKWEFKQLQKVEMGQP